MSHLVLVRHGRSQWNDENRFTGWVDVPLAQPGRAEAIRAGERLHELGIRFDRAYTSTLQRAITTGRLILDVLDQTDLEQIRAWELNERFYGALTGRNKDETREKFGEEQVHIWRRSYATAPPGEPEGHRRASDPLLRNPHPPGHDGGRRRPRQRARQLAARNRQGARRARRRGGHPAGDRHGRADRLRDAGRRGQAGPSDAVRGDRRRSSARRASRR